MSTLKRRGPHVFLWLLVWRFWLPDAVLAQDSVPHDIRSDRSNENPIQLIEQRERGVTFQVNLSTEVLGNFAGGKTRAAIWESLLIAGMEIDFEKAAGVPGLRLAVSGLYGAGPGLTNKAVHDFNVLSNIDTYDSLRLYEAWLQEDLWNGKFSLRLGQMLADSEFFVSDYGALFLNSSFGAIPLVSQNLVPPIFPVAAPGLRLRTAPNDSFYIEAAGFSGNVGDPETNNKHGTFFSFRDRDGALAFFEVGYLVNPAASKGSVTAEPPDLAGSYKLGGFYDSGRFEDGLGRATKRGNEGFYFLAEQEVWHPEGRAGRSLAFFGRAGFAPNDRNLVPVYFDTGFNFQGVLASRANDTLGLGFSYTQLSDELVAGGGDEEVVELTYRVVLGDHIFLQPDLQFIIHPGATDSVATAVVAGLRLNLSY